MMDRFEKTGRETNAEKLADMHFRAQQTVLRLAREYAANPNVQISVVDNSGGEPRVITPAALSSRSYRSLDEARARVHNQLDHELETRRQNEFWTPERQATVRGGAGRLGEQAGHTGAQQAAAAAGQRPVATAAVLEFEPVTFTGNPEMDGRTGQISSRSGAAQVVSVNDRQMVLVRVKGVGIPFYLAIGAAGGRWRPFLGMDAGGWLNQGSHADIQDYYGSATLRGIAEQLDQQMGATSQAHEVSAGAVFEALNTGLAGIGIHPVARGTQAARQEIAENQQRLLAFLGESRPAPYGISKEGSSVLDHNPNARADFEAADITVSSGTEIFGRAGIVKGSKLKTIIDAVTQWGRDHGLFGQHDTPALGAPVEISERALSGDLSHGAAVDKIKSAAVLPALLRHAIHIQTETSPSHPGMKHHLLAAKLNLDGALHTVSLVVREVGGRLFYDHELVNEKGGLPAETRIGSNTRHGSKDDPPSSGKVVRAALFVNRSETGNGGPGASSLNEWGKTRFGSRLRADERLRASWRSQMAPNAYRKETRQEWQQRANEFIATHGLEGAYALFSDPDSGLSASDRPYLGMQLLLSIDAEIRRAEQAGDAGRVDLLDDLMHELGASVDALAHDAGKWEMADQAGKRGE